MLTSEKLLVKSAKNGSEKAFEVLIKKYTPPVYGLLVDMTKNIHDAEDLTQDTFSKAFCKITNFKEKSRFSTWIYRIAYNIAIDFLRKKKRQISTDWSDHNHSNKLRWEPKEYSDKNELINRALHTLTVNQRSVVSLHYYQDMKLTEIAHIMDCAESTVRVRLFRALKKLKKKLKDLEYE